jgi:hypothetical protein
MAGDCAVKTEELQAYRRHVGKSNINDSWTWLTPTESTKLLDYIDALESMPLIKTIQEQQKKIDELLKLGVDMRREIQRLKDFIESNPTYRCFCGYCSSYPMTNCPSCECSGHFKLVSMLEGEANEGSVSNENHA